MPSLALRATLAALFLAVQAGCTPGPVPAALPPAMAVPCVAGVGAPSGTNAPLPAVAPSASSSAAAASSAAPAPSAPPSPAELEQALALAKKALAGGDWTGADHQIDVAAKSAGDNAHLRYMVARVRATRFAYTADFERAAAALVAVIPELAKHPESSDEFWAHNGMMMIREAEGDPAAALAEDDQATLAAARGVWDLDERETLAYLKDRWHRAYLTRMLAQTRTGTARQALALYADSALADYKSRARQLGSNEDSIAVLEAYFAALDGDRAAALQAARKVDPAKDDDLEDLYLVVVGLEAGGDHTAAEAVRRRMRQSASVYLARPIMLRWLDLDSKAPQKSAFTPWHPS
jgi:hypothetical protein